MGVFRGLCPLFFLSFISNNLAHKLLLLVFVECIVRQMASLPTVVAMEGYCVILATLL